MTHLRSKRLPGAAGRTSAAVLGLVAALGLGAIGEAEADPHASSAAAPRWTDRAHGFASLAPGTHNVIIRNMTIRDSAIEGDWDCGVPAHGPAVTSPH
ncbi:hypothetical protein [Streptomyces chartreusis]